nr:hypothetical protein [Tanacetum cinerariifolium]
KASNDNPIPFYDPIISGTPSNLTPSGEADLFLETKTSSTSLNSYLKETYNFDNSLPEFTTLSKVLFDAKYESDSSDDQSCFDEDEDIRLIEKLLYDNSSPRLPKEFVSANSYAESESFSPSPIPVKDSDSLMEEIDLFCTPDYPMLPGIVDKDYDSEKQSSLGCSSVPFLSLLIRL